MLNNQTRNNLILYVKQSLSKTSTKTNYTIQLSPRIIVPRVLQVLNHQPVILYVQHQKLNIPRPLQQLHIDNQLQQQLNQQYSITPRPIPIISNPAPPRPPTIPKKPKHLRFLREK